MSNVEYQAEKYVVELRRPSPTTSWGFRLQGGVDFSTPLSVQVVQPNSVAEQCGLKGGDAILTINGVNTDQLTHEQAKQEIVRADNYIDVLVQRGAVKIWKPQVTPLSELRPQELNTIKTATGEEIQPVQKTSLAINTPQEPCRIGSSHNRSAQPFGAQKQAVPNVVHAQYNTPIGLYSADNIANTYTTQTEGLQKEMANLDLQDTEVGQNMTGTFQNLPPKQPQQSARYEDGQGDTPNYRGYTNPDLQSASFKRIQEELDKEDQSGIGGFRSVVAPVGKPLGEQKPQQPSMRCGGCNMLATGVIVKANGVPYHVSCFRCESCGMNLKQKGYFVVEDKLYCETHARQKSQPPGPDMVAVPVYR
ncbi:PDZ and LIM domain protein 3-like isoform X2 [Babylonia areolata]|uniref:PDZ and LIM domain protein 3-like isoform X1 n=1 Tax=Babylonia areolata TaxID=304850 RepID=UPI003FD5BBBA